MNLPVLIKQLYGEFTLTGLYSFEFANRGKKITEIFFMMPPQEKSVSESTRSTTNPTLSCNYNTDAGNATKKIDISGNLWFPIVGSPSNPVTADPSGNNDLIDGLTEFFKMRWMLIRYRDYTLTRGAKIDVPVIPMMLSNEITALYRKVSKLMKDGRGALYDEIQVIFHDYDMDDHWYCRIDEFSASQSASKYIAINYRISGEGYERYVTHTASPTQIKTTLNEEVNISNEQLQGIGYQESLDAIDPTKSITNVVMNNSDFYSNSLAITEALAAINTENENIQAGNATPFDTLLGLLTNLVASVESVQTEYINNLLTDTQQAAYAAGTLTIDSILDYTLLSFYNSLQKIKMFATNAIGAIVSTPKQNTISFYANADEYTLTSDQFDNTDNKKIMNDSTFYYYTVQSGDTARTIAYRELGDTEKFIEILRLNNITESDLIDGTIIGTKIKIPFDSASSVRSADNLVYEPDDSDLNKFLHGSAIYTDVTNSMKPSPTGDIMGYSGIQVTYDSLFARLSNQKGSLNVFAPDWGVIPLGDGDAPLMVRIDKYLSDLVNQIQSDPRVESVNLDIKKLRLQGEALTTYGTISFIGTEEQKEMVVNS
jgi:hypothetical protein